MDRVTSPTQLLLDGAGRPLSDRLQAVLRAILPRLRNRFPDIGDDLVITEVLEEAGRRIEEHEQTAGLVGNLDAYAWVTALNVARSKLRRSSMRLVRASFGSEESRAVFDALRSPLGTPEHIESDILMRELLAQLTPEEQALCVLKELGFSSRQIADQQGTSVARVDTLFYRIKRKIRAALQPRSADDGVRRTVVGPTKSRTA